MFPNAVVSCISIASKDEPPEYVDIEKVLEDIDVRLDELAAPIPKVRWDNDGHIFGHRYPLAEELLKPEFKLTGLCKNVVIKEWRGERSANGMSIIDNTCNQTIEAFFPFVKERGFTVKKDVKPPLISVSIIPWNPETNGREYRALNDAKWRFNSREKFCNTDGRVCNILETSIPLLAHADRISNWIFIMNDVEIVDTWMPSFSSVWAHELFHICSYTYGVYHSFKGDAAKKIAQEEQLTRKFTKHLGYQYN